MCDKKRGGGIDQGSAREREEENNRLTNLSRSLHFRFTTCTLITALWSSSFIGEIKHTRRARDRDQKDVGPAAGGRDECGSLREKRAGRTAEPE